VGVSKASLSKGILHNGCQAYGQISQWLHCCHVTVHVCGFSHHLHVVGVGLSHRMCRHDRLYYLLHTSRAAGISWQAALSMPDKEWDEMYPAYRTWWAQKGR
jgi:hypothetical protein